MRKSTIFGVLFILLGAFSLFWYAWGDANLGTQYKVEQIKKQADGDKTSAEEIEQNIEKAKIKNDDKTDIEFDNDGNIVVNSGDYDGQYETDENGYPISHDDTITYDVSNIEYSSDPPSSNLNTSYIVGKIYVPSVNVLENIYEGMSNDNLWAGVGTVKPNQQMGKRNYGIAGHHMENPNLLFSPLMYSKKGEMIYLSDKRNVYIYEINKIVDVDPSQGQYMLDSQGNELVTLITCTDPWGSARRIIQGKLIKEIPISQANENIQNAFR